MNTIDFQIVDIIVYDNLSQEFSDSQGLLGQEFLENIQDDYVSDNEHPIVLLFGRTADKKDVLARIKGYLPYLDYISDDSPKRLTSILSEKVLSKKQHDWFYRKNSVEILKKRKLFGWNPSDDDINDVKTFKVIRIFFPSLHSRNRAQYVVVPGYEMAEQKVKPEKQFADLYDILESGWITCSYRKQCGMKISHCAIEFETQT